MQKMRGKRPEKAIMRKGLQGGREKIQCIGRREKSDVIGQDPVTEMKVKSPEKIQGGEIDIKGKIPGFFFRKST